MQLTWHAFCAELPLVPSGLNFMTAACRSVTSLLPVSSNLCKNFLSWMTNAFPGACKMCDPSGPKTTCKRCILGWQIFITKDAFGRHWQGGTVGTLLERGGSFVCVFIQIMKHRTIPGFAESSSSVTKHVCPWNGRTQRLHFRIPHARTTVPKIWGISTSTV